MLVVQYLPVEAEEVAQFSCGKSQLKVCEEVQIVYHTKLLERDQLDNIAHVQWFKNGQIDSCSKAIVLYM